MYSFTEVEKIAADIYGGRRLRLKPFSVVFEFPAMVASTPYQVMQKIPSNADFLAFEYRWASYDSDANGLLESTLLQIEDSGSNERFFDTPCPIVSCCNLSGTNPSDLGYPRRVAGNSTLTATVTTGLIVFPNFSQLVLNGVLVYDLDG